MTNDSPHASRPAQGAPLVLLREWLIRESEALCRALPWERDSKEVRAALRTAIGKLPGAERQVLDELCERMDRMADEAGALREFFRLRAPALIDHYLVLALDLPGEARASAVLFDPASGRLRLPGKPEIHFSGDQQITVVHELYLAWQRGSPDVKAESLLAKAKSGSPSIPLLFRGRRNWKTYLASPRRGWYRLNI